MKSWLCFPYYCLLAAKKSLKDLELAVGSEVTFRHARFPQIIRGAVLSDFLGYLYVNKNSLKWLTNGVIINSAFMCYKYWHFQPKFSNQTNGDFFD